MYILNAEIINKLLPACYKGDERPFINGVLIRDINDEREYIATNGHLLLKYTVKLDGEEEKLEKPVLLRLPCKLKYSKKNPFVNFYIKGDEGHIYGEKDNILLNLCFELPENLDRVIDSTADYKEANTWKPCKPQYLQIICDFFEIYALYAPKVSPWDDGDFKAIRWDLNNKMALLMPARI